MIEVEIRAKVNDFQSIKNKLRELGADFVHKKTQIDRVYGRKQDQDREQKLVEGSFSARIRQVDRSIRLDFKEIIRGSGGMEISIPFTDMGLADKFLTRIGYEEAFIITKKREVYSLGKFTIALDRVEQLGNFIEIELGTERESVKEILFKECEQLLKRVAPNARIEKKKYGDLMQEIINRKNK